jgi:hypothetical protein
VPSSPVENETALLAVTIAAILIVIIVGALFGKKKTFSSLNSCQKSDAEL